jgi:hypothetical protein
MERAAIPRNIAMGIAGHRTESVYRRAMTSCLTANLKQAAMKLEGHISEPANGRAKSVQNGRNRP